MNKLTKDHYHQMQADCDGLCDITHDMVASDDPGFMRCVTCPFCKQTVDAVLTDTTIACPSCKVVVGRSS